MRRRKDGSLIEVSLSASAVRNSEGALIGIATIARDIIEDTGRGIAADFLPQVFDRFRQAESARHRSHGGLGLGLSIVQHLVGEHDGTVSAKSAGEGRGSTFTVTLPLVSAPSPVAATLRPMLREEWQRCT